MLPGLNGETRQPLNPVSNAGKVIGRVPGKLQKLAIEKSSSKVKSQTAALMSREEAKANTPRGTGACISAQVNIDLKMSSLPPGMS